MSKADKRIAAKEEKAQKAGEKKAITVAKILGHDKTPHSADLSPPQKTPAEAPASGGIFRQKVTVSSEKEDRLGSWSWKVDRNWHTSPGDNHILNFTNSYHQAKTWREVFEEKSVGKAEAIKKKHVSYSVSQIVKEARERLVELKMDDYEEIFRFRMSNLERLYGFIVGATFITVWYDPTHDVYPVD